MDNITIIRDNGTSVSFKTCASFIKCITKTDGPTIDDAEDLYLIMPMYKLIKHSLDYGFTLKMK